MVEYITYEQIKEIDRLMLTPEAYEKLEEMLQIKTRTINGIKLYNSKDIKIFFENVYTISEAAKKLDLKTEVLRSRLKSSGWIEKTFQLNTSKGLGKITCILEEEFSGYQEDCEIVRVVDGKPYLIEFKTGLFITFDGLRLEDQRFKDVGRKHFLKFCKEVDIENKRYHNKTMYSCKDIHYFFDNHIPVSQLPYYLKYLASAAAQKLRTLRIEPIRLKLGDPERFYLSYENFEKAKQYFLLVNNDASCQILPKYKALERLVLSRFCGSEALKDLGIQPYFEIHNFGSFYHKGDIQMMEKEQEKRIKELQTKFYTYGQVAKKFGILESNLSLILKKRNIEIFYPPNIAQKGIYKNNPILIKKKVIEQIVNEREEREQVTKIFSVVTGNPYLSYLELLRHWGIIFTQTGQATAKYWDEFVKKKLREHERISISGIASLVSSLAKTSNVLKELTLEKEIFQYSAKELNLAIFNKKVPKSYQLQLYHFLGNLDKILEIKGIKHYNFSLVTNPKYTLVTNPKNKEIYSLEKYISLLEYVGDVKLHKRKAIKDAKKFLEKKEGYKSYASVWLYILLHMNNAWRHWDVATFQRLELELFNELTLDWLNENDLDMKIAKDIVNHVQALDLIHSKTGATRHFIMSDELTLSFATSIIICEIIRREQNMNREILMDFTRRDLYFSDSQVRKFFRRFKDKEFKFESMAMNRTVISLATSVIQKITNRNPVEISKLLRSHPDIEITNIYIDVPQEYLDMLAKQLFELGNFGYTYDMMGTLLFGERRGERQHRINQALLVENVFGDTWQIENLARIINALSSERAVVREILEGMNFNELNEKYHLFEFGLLTSKKRGYQCLVAECIFPVRACEDCPLSIPNRYALSQLGETVKDRIQNFKQTYTNIIHKAELIRVSNLLYSALSLLQTAIAKFGRDEVSAFIKGGIDSINKELEELPSFIKNVTLLEAGD